MITDWSLCDGLANCSALAQAFVQHGQIVLNIGVARVLRLRLKKDDAGAATISAKEIRIPLIVQDFGCRPDQTDGLRIGAVGEVEALQLVVARRQSDPGLDVLRALERGDLSVEAAMARIAEIEEA